MSDMNSCPLPELIAEFRKVSKKAGEENDILRCMLMGIIASRFQHCQDLLSRWHEHGVCGGPADDELIADTEKELGIGTNT